MSASGGLYASNAGRWNIKAEAAVGGGAYPMKLSSGDGGSYTGGVIKMTIDGVQKVNVNTSNVAIDSAISVTVPNVSGPDLAHGIDIANSANKHLDLEVSTVGAHINSLNGKLFINDLGNAVEIGGDTKVLGTFSVAAPAVSGAGALVSVLSGNWTGTKVLQSVRFVADGQPIQVLCVASDS